MKLYFAPLEGITTFTYRNTHFEMFGGCDEYFSPFLTPTDNERLSAKTMRDILPEKNTVNLRVQCLANSGEAFINLVEKISRYGYNEVNLNLGCPSGTVVKKSKGSGALRNLDQLYSFLDYIYSHSKMDISIKSRTGFSSHTEFEEILKIYSHFPVSELIIHPRIREEFYKGTPNLNSFELAYNNYNFKLCYNGDITSVSDFNKITERYPDLNGVMIGRGALRNPAIFREINGGEKLKTSELISFSNQLEKRYIPILGSEVYTLHKLKEIWIYIMENYPDEKKIFKAVKKSNSLPELNNAINCLPEL